MTQKTKVKPKSKRNIRLPKKPKEKWKFRFYWPQMGEMISYFEKMEKKVGQKSDHGSGAGAFSAGWTFSTKAKATSAFNKIKNMRLKSLGVWYGVQKEDSKNRLF